MMTIVKYGGRALVFLAVALLPLSCSQGASDPPPQETVISVTVLKPVRGEVQEVIKAIAISRPARESVLSAGAVGKVERVVREGERVAAGSIVAVIDMGKATAVAEAATARRVSSSAEADKLGRDYERKARLAGEGVVSQQDLDAAKTAWQTSASGRDAAVAAEAEAGAMLGDRIIRAPFDGVALKRMVEVGEIVSPGTPIVHFGDISALEIPAVVSEKDAFSIKAGSPAFVIFDADASDTYEAKVVRVDKVLAGGARTAEAVVKLENPAHRFPAGMLARVSLEAASRKNVFRLPNSAIRTDPDGKFVWIVEEGMAANRKVTTGIRGRTESEIVEGIDEETIVVIRGGGGLKEGDKVEATFL